MENLLILVGCSASGKDTVMNRLIKEFDVKPVISYTTRPIRDCEQEGREYHFITEEEFERMKDNDEFVETRVYNTVSGNWYYGLPKNGIDLEDDNNYITILDFDGLLELEKWLRDIGQIDKLTSVYIDVTEQNRLIRSLNREQNMTKRQVEEVIRRYHDDNSNVVPAKSYCHYSFNNNTYEEFDDLIEYIYEYVLY